MKLQCRCGEIIHDMGNPTPDKARFVTSEAWTDYLDSLKNEEVQWRQFARLLDRDLFQCGECGRLFVLGRGTGAEYWCFAPEDDRVPKDLFRTGRKGKA